MKRVIVILLVILISCLLGIYVSIVTSDSTAENVFAMQSSNGSCNKLGYDGTLNTEDKCPLIVSPGLIVEGASNIDQTITGNGTHFNAETTVQFNCIFITINSITVKSETELIVNITVPYGEPDTYCGVTIKTGDETIVCEEVLRYVHMATAPSISSIEPNNARAGETLDITISIDFCHGGLANNPAVLFSCSGISVNNISVTTDTYPYGELTANITINRYADICSSDVSVTYGGEFGSAHCYHCFDVLQPVCPLTFSPSSFHNGIILPRIRTLTITGTNSVWTGESTVTIEGINILTTQVQSATKISVLAIIPSKLRLVAGNKTVTITTGTDTCTGTLVIQ
jgi:hypothetical protein